MAEKGARVLVDTFNQLFQKGKISEILETSKDRNGDSRLARVIPSTSDGAVTAPLVIQWWLRGEMGNLKPTDEVFYIMCEDGSGSIFGRADGDWTGTVRGDLKFLKGAV